MSDMIANVNDWGAIAAKQGTIARNCAGWERVVREEALKSKFSDLVVQNEGMKDDAVAIFDGAAPSSSASSASNVSDTNDCYPPHIGCAASL